MRAVGSRTALAAPKAVAKLGSPSIHLVSVLTHEPFSFCRREFLGQFPPPVVLHPLGVLDLVNPKGIQRLGKRVVVVIQARLAHAGIVFHVVVLAYPLERGLTRGSSLLSPA